MPTITSSSPRAVASDITRQALIGLSLTAVHHAYGAYVYRTPWRYHVLLIAIPAAALIVGSQAVVRADPRGMKGAIARWTFLVTTVVVPVLSFGVFEGLYNHVVKNALYFTGTATTMMMRLFPPPSYEMPNNLFFEITGMLQVVPAALIVRHLVRMIRVHRPTGGRVRDGALTVRRGGLDSGG
ncbi:MAG TPA: hypothetical protein VFI52_07035 [Gemmatimonadaceae bacterium]|nr:hypothetical protein [Gemmatimonadaceae bacterium]